MALQTGAWRALTDRVYVAVCEPAAVNVGLVVGDDHVLMIDTGSHPDQGRELARTAAEIAGRPVDRVVVTHWHWDHWLGLAGVGAEQSVGHEVLESMATHGELLDEAARLGVQPDDIVAPTRLISLAAAFDLGGVRAEVVHFGAAHTAGDLMVFVPKQNVIFAGDLLEQGADPSFGHDSRVETWPGVLDGALGAATDDTIFVPGHGEPVDRFFVFRQRAEIAMLHAEAERLARQGVKTDAAVTASEWPFTEQTLRAALPLAYAELERKGLKARLQLPLLGG